MKAFLEINLINLSKHAKQHRAYEIQHLEQQFVTGSADSVFYFVAEWSNSKISCKIKSMQRISAPKAIDPKW